MGHLNIFPPGCGTAIINGVGLGLSNVINRGPIGVVGAAGTGVQEVTCLINNLGSGITHAIGVGGRDLSEGVGGIMTLESLKMLQNDDNTEVLIIISKPPSATVADKIINAIGESKKPTVVCSNRIKGFVNQVCIHKHLYISVRCHNGCRFFNTWQRTDFLTYTH